MQTQQAARVFARGACLTTETRGERGHRDGKFRAVENPDSRDYCVIAAYNTGPRNVTRGFSNNKTEAINEINQLDPPALFERLRSNLPYEETRQYVIKVTGYRKQFVTAASSPATAMQ